MGTISTEGKKRLGVKRLRGPLDPAGEADALGALIAANAGTVTESAGFVHAAPEQDYPARPGATLPFPYDQVGQGA